MGERGQEVGWGRKWCVRMRRIIVGGLQRYFSLLLKFAVEVKWNLKVILTYGGASVAVGFVGERLLTSHV